MRWPLSEPSCLHTSLTSFWEMPWLLSTSFCISFLTCMFNKLSAFCLHAKARGDVSSHTVFDLSFRYARRDVLPLGKFTLNLSGCPTVASYTQRFFQTIQQLVPSVSYHCHSKPSYLFNFSWNDTEIFPPCSRTIWAWASRTWTRCGWCLRRTMWPIG